MYMENTTSNEGQANAGTSTQKATSNINVGVQPQVPEAIRRAEEINSKLTENIRQLDERLGKLAEYTSNKILGGITSGGSAPSQPVEETPHQYMKRVMREGWPKK